MAKRQPSEPTRIDIISDGAGFRMVLIDRVPFEGTMEMKSVIGGPSKVKVDGTYLRNVDVYRWSSPVPFVSVRPEDEERAKLMKPLSTKLEGAHGG